MAVKSFKTLNPALKIAQKTLTMKYIPYFLTNIRLRWTWLTVTNRNRLAYYGVIYKFYSLGPWGQTKQAKLMDERGS